MNYITLYKALWITILALFIALIPLNNMAYATASDAAASIGNIPSNKTQNLEVIKQKAQEFLVMQTQGAPGKVNIKIGDVDKLLKLENCLAMDAFFPSGSRAWGKTTVGVRCGAPSNWTIYVQAKVSVFADYLAAAKPLVQGQQISSQDIMVLQGDLSTLPTGVMTNPDEVLGRVIASSINSGTVIRQDLLKSPLVINQGQTVRVISSGKGFSVSTDAQALANANDGQVIKVKTASGTIVTGIAKPGGNVVVSF